MPLITILRGFKVPLPVLDSFLLAHGIYETEDLCSGIPPSHTGEPDAVTTLLRNKVGNGDTKTRVFVPYKMSFDHASHAYIAYDWIMVFAQRKIKPDELSDTPPAGFEAMRREILSHSEGLVDDAACQNGLYVVVTDEASYVPPAVKERQTVRI